ncbi:MAG: BlaI/MecI/CopY family transcriptional regulator [Acidobacteria bacterium]|nr:BlaI/MecI/CopY family transcriptional regulator [Acidobacteriota bacterium]
MTGKTRPSLPTPGELSILNTLWMLGEGTVDDIVNHQKSRPNYKTTQTLLRIMEQKGFVQHRLCGRAFVFQPCITRQRVAKRSLRRLLQEAFGGSPVQLLVNLLEARPATEDELSELESLIRKHKKERFPDRRP